jgi:hypothetical protein
MPDRLVYPEPPAWPHMESHCAVCLRLFAREAETDRHEDQECDEAECWCLSFCWIEYGGDCFPAEDVDFSEELVLWVWVRSLQHALATSTSASPNETAGSVGASVEGATDVATSAPEGGPT